MERWRKELYLAHHGIKGQRWGVRKGPPYPLDAPDHTASEKKAGWRKSLDKPAQTPKKKSKPVKPEQPLKVLSKPNEPSELHEDPQVPTMKFFAKFFPSIAEREKNWKDYTIKNKEGKKIGEFTTELRNKGEEMNISWLGIRDKYGNRGHGQSAMRLAIDDARKQGVKYVTLEVPDEDDNARHIYDKLGFKETGNTQFHDLLIEMRLDL